MIENDIRNYKILNTIATGGTAVLYKAIQTSLDRPVVVKRLHSHLTSDPSFTSRFELEAKAAASMDHENIVRIIDFGSSNKSYYIIMEYIDGISLKEVIKRWRFLDQELALIICHSICMGLDHAHQRGIIHRDIKPANIMITKEGQIKITDFGLVKIHQSQTKHTVANSLIGTPLYMSPEQAIGNNIDCRSDIFSVGTICYEMITGIQPFSGENYAAVIQNIINNKPVPPSRLHPEISDGVESIVMKTLNREPSKRFRTALEMARAIESCIGPESISSSHRKLQQLTRGESKNAATKPRTNNPNLRKRRSFIPIGIAAAVLIFAASLLGLNNSGLIKIKEKIISLLSANPESPRRELLEAGGESGVGTQVEILSLESQNLTLPTAGADTMEKSSKQSGDNGTNSTSSVPPHNEKDVPEETETEYSETNGSSQPENMVRDRESPESVEKTQKEPVKAVTGYLDIYVTPQADIEVDGEHKAYGNSFGPVEISTGVHEITCRKIDYKTYRETLNIKKSELSKRHIILQKMTGTIILNTMPGASVYINGKFKGITPLKTPFNISVGSHTVKLKKTGYHEWLSNVSVAENDTVRLNISLTRLSSTH